MYRIYYVSGRHSKGEIAFALNAEEASITAKTYTQHGYSVVIIPPNSPFTMGVKNVR